MGPLLDLRHYQLIHTIARTGRVTEAAEKLGLTPSALSHRIREAERRLDVILYTRIHRRLRMTPAAEYLAQVAERVLTDLGRAEDDVRRMNQGIEHVVRLAVEAYSSYHWLPGFVRFLKSRTASIDIQITAGAAREPGKSLLNRHIDVAIVSGEPTMPGVSRVPLFDDELLFIMPPDHRLAGKAFIEGPDIVGEDFITYTKVPEPDREFARLFRPSETYPRWTVTVEVPEAIVELVAAGLGTSVLAGWAVQSALRDGRIAAARVSPTGLSVPWWAILRDEDADENGAIAQVATLLAEWCASPGGGFSSF